MTFDAASDKCIQEGVQNGWKGSANLVTIWNKGEEDFFRNLSKPFKCALSHRQYFVYSTPLPNNLSFFESKKGHVV